MTAAPQLDPLDERLIQAALRLIQQEGLERLSLRRVARRAGVSHGAPLRHFRSLADLCSEVAGHGFRLLSESVEKSGAGLPPGAGALARLAAAGRAYVDVAVANPGLFALMFRPEDLDPDNPFFQEASREAFQHLVRHVRAAQDGGWQTDRDTALLAGCLWAAFHGLATLWAQGALVGAVPHASLDAAVATTLELILANPQGGST